MSELSTPDVLHPANMDTPGDTLTIVGALKNTTASSIQLSVDNFVSWFALPTIFIEEATCVGLVKSPEPNKREYLPIFSISLKTPETQSERFLFDLVIPPIVTAFKAQGMNSALKA